MCWNPGWRRRAPKELEGWSEREGSRLCGLARVRGCRPRPHEPCQPNASVGGATEGSLPTEANGTEGSQGQGGNGTTGAFSAESSHSMPQGAAAAAFAITASGTTGKARRTCVSRLAAIAPAAVRLPAKRACGWGLYAWSHPGSDAPAQGRACGAKNAVGLFTPRRASQPALSMLGTTSASRNRA